MNRIIHIVFVASTIILLSSCSSIVRFSSTEQRNKPLTTKEKENNNTDNKNEININPKEKDFQINDIRLKILAEANSWIGTPYVYGGNSRIGADCSGFVQSVFLAVGISLPRTSQQQFDYSERINLEEIEIGDLIFFKRKGKISHVGIYAGDSEMIHSSSSRGVIRQPIEEYLRNNNYAGTGKIIGKISKK